MQLLIDHARLFSARNAGRIGGLGHLATGQQPDVLFITCSDSRVMPALIMGAAPGELFELRTAGNIIPEYRPRRPSSEAATIEYAIEVLGVPDVVVCGHSHCGAVGAMVREEDLSSVPAVRAWLTSTMDTSTTSVSAVHPDADITEPVQRHVLTQLDRLRGYPKVARKVAQGSLRLHGWFYEVHTGSVLAYSPESDGFQSL